MVGRSVLGAAENREARIPLVLRCKTITMLEILNGSTWPQWSYYCIQLSFFYHHMLYVTSWSEPKISLPQGVFKSQWDNSRARVVFWPPDFRWRRAPTFLLRIGESIFSLTVFLFFTSCRSNFAAQDQEVPFSHIKIGHAGEKARHATCISTIGTTPIEERTLKRAKKRGEFSPYKKYASFCKKVST